MFMVLSTISAFTWFGFFVKVCVELSNGNNDTQLERFEVYAVCFSVVAGLKVVYNSFNF